MPFALACREMARSGTGPVSLCVAGGLQSGLQFRRSDPGDDEQAHSPQPHDGRQVLWVLPALRPVVEGGHAAAHHKCAPSEPRAARLASRPGSKWGLHPSPGRPRGVSVDRRVGVVLPRRDAAGGHVATIGLPGGSSIRPVMGGLQTVGGRISSARHSIDEGSVVLSVCDHLTAPLVRHRHHMGMCAAATPEAARKAAATTGAATSLLRFMRVLLVDRLTLPASPTA
jgi:hypothetical protein